MSGRRTEARGTRLGGLHGQVRSLRRVAAKLNVRIAEQAGWSLVTFLGSALGASVLSVQEFGALSLAASTVLLMQALGRSIFTETLALAAVDHQGQVAAFRAVIYRQLGVVAPALLLLGGVVAFLVEDDAHRPLGFATAIAAVVTLFADVNRSQRLISGEYALALRALGGALVVQAGTTTLLFVGTNGDPASFMLGWSSGMAVLALGRTARISDPAVGGAWRFLQRRYAPIFLGEALLTAGATNVGMVLIATFGGLEASAATRAALLLLFPVNMTIQAISQVIVPTVSRELRSTGGARRIRIAAIAATFVVILYGLIVSQLSFVTGPLLGDSEDIAKSVFVGPLAWLAGTVFFIFPWAACRSVGRASAGLIARATVAPFTAFGPGLFIYAYGLHGVLLAYALVGVVTLLCGWRMLHVAQRGMASPSARSLVHSTETREETA